VAAAAAFVLSLAIFNVSGLRWFSRFARTLTLRFPLPTGETSRR